MTIIKSNNKTSSSINISRVINGARNFVSYSALHTLIYRSLPVFFALMLTIGIGVNGYAQDGSLLTESYPDRYTVEEGDTLWGISGKFLRDPWRWPEVWQGNPQVENPDLIFPGDVLVLTFIDGRPVLKALRRQEFRDTVKLSPSPRATRFSDAVPLIDPAAILPYINSPLVTNETEMKQAPYVVEGFNNHLVLGKNDQFYARGIEDQTIKKYRIYKPGRHFVDPVSGEDLGWEAIHLGDANLLKEGDPTRLSITSSYEDINIRDRLRPVLEEAALPFFAPNAPENVGIRGMILDTPNKSTELGALSIVAINLGEREGMVSGNVLRVRSQKVPKKDPLTGERYFIPEEDVGLALVFRTFEKVSYAIITDSNRQVSPGDILVSPYAD